MCRTCDIKDADFKIDFRNGTLIFPDESASLVFSSHMIEHISNESASFLFSEVYRILKPGGVFRVVCPDMDKIIQAYRENDLYFFLKGAGVQSFLIAGIDAGNLSKESLLLHNNLIHNILNGL